MIIEKIKDCAKLMRIMNSIMVGFAVLVAVAIAVGRGFLELEPMKLVSGFIVGFSVSASAMVLNDIFDIEIDKVNAPTRPLPSGRMSKGEAYLCYFILAFLGLFFSTFTGIDSFLVAFSGILVSALYDYKLKVTGFLGNFSVAFATSLPFLYAFTIVDEANPTVLVFWGMVFLSVLAREIVKDIADIEGDRIKNARTIPLIYGVRRAAQIAFLLYLIAISLSPIPVFLRLVNYWIYVPSVLVVDFLFIYGSIRILRNPIRKEALYHKKIALYAMLIGLIGFVGSVLL